MKRLVLLCVLISACSSTKFTGKVLSCADQKPLVASLHYRSTGSVNNNMAGEMPENTKDDGSYEADVALASGAGVMMTIVKDGYEPKDQPLSSGSAQIICLDPKKR